MITNRAYFVCGTDTDVGKTIVCTGLLKAIPHAGGLKAIQTGSVSDQDVYLKVTTASKTKTLFHFPLAASPHLAAQKIDYKLGLQTLINAVETEVNQQDLTIIEGSGGIMTPVNEDYSFIDLMAALNYPVILVIKNQLGTINQALLSINVLQSRGVEILGLVFTHTTSFISSEQKLITEDNIEFIKHRSGIEVLASLPFMPNIETDPTSWEVIAKLLQPAVHRITNKKQQERVNQLAHFDQLHLWHPYEDILSASQKPIVKRAIGAKLILETGEQLVDGTSSWWSAIHGYSHPQLIKAIQNQSATLSHVMFGGLTHKPAIALAEKLLSIVPNGLEHVFYSDSGSVAVEVALKMALQYWQGLGKANKSKFISFHNGYHGDTFGAMSVCDQVDGMHHLFKEVLPHHIFSQKPPIGFSESFDEALLQPFKVLLQQHSHECAAVIIEPIVQGAGGMWFYHADYLKAIKKLCDDYNLLLIIDEIATGFGRTGELFACEWAGISPDIMCVGKAITGGMLTLAAALTTSKIAKGISKSGNPLMHGPTYMANPLACQVAITSIDLLLNSDWQELVLQIEHSLKEMLTPCVNHPDVKAVRVLGAIGVVEMKERVNTVRLQKFFIEQGVWIRPFKNIIYIMPPYIISHDELTKLTQAICEAVETKQWV